MTDDTNEFLKDEEENDPAKIQKEAIELQREGLKLMREEIQKRKAIPAQGQAFIATEEYLTAQEPPKSIAFEVRKIENGWILGLFRNLRGGFSDKPIETYCPTAEELVKVAAAKVEAFTKEATASAAKDGPPPFQLAPGEAL